MTSLSGGECHNLKSSRTMTILSRGEYHNLKVVVPHGGCPPNLNDLTDPRLAAKDRAKRPNQMTADLFSEENRGLVNDTSAAEVSYEVLLEEFGKFCNYAEKQTRTKKCPNVSCFSETRGGVSYRR
ncbi:uncharacterized protein LOC111463801 isoform X3 [Cucurbita moschata]|uniref:Uncharacterized protein LOC111463801 isoform X3 n=1 Tax=Cucurbita moschata TaxID=3662 RepID=A0A6J1HI45_CUCMO|nr:uncharacterized protein LOC111463801 isoform X3 [Cucurbita moschata]